tara:strand:+ start:4462 stop:4803 length:342 start_codon:yes stop_codon:yes gene_type:complete
MSKREVKRNGRGQIVSYEIDGAFDSNVDSQTYGDVGLETNTPNGPRLYSSAQKQAVASQATKTIFNNGTQPNSPNYDDFTDIKFSDEFTNKVDFKEPRDNFAVFSFNQIAIIP